MMKTMTKRWLGAGVAAASMMAGAGAYAADYPQRPITLVVPYAAGGTTDILGRALAEALAGELKQAVVVENKPGANGTRGASGMKQARPDGYTLTMVPLGVFRQPYIQQVNYDPLKDLTYVSMVGGYNYAIAVADKAPWKTIQELIEHARSHPGEIFYGVSARYSVNEFLMMDLGRKAGADWTSVPFDGSVREHLRDELVKKGLDLRFNTDVERIDKRADGVLAVTLSDGSVLETDCVFYATGRRAMLDDLGLENTGVRLAESGYIEVDDEYRTSEPSILAIGDVIG
ncbi:tripartite tricarboxylate transporter family receptor domain protein, partial [Bordetella bronchiseptica E012]|uniref:tripartite tricarboxylate transporter substrate binding protein n=1 Tax=Bordetella bronchiseptica TaxID=518 RepID=UPI00046173EA